MPAKKLEDSNNWRISLCARFSIWLKFKFSILMLVGAGRRSPASWLNIPNFILTLYFSIVLVVGGNRNSPVSRWNLTNLILRRTFRFILFQWQFQPEPKTWQKPLITSKKGRKGKNKQNAVIKNTETRGLAIKSLIGTLIHVLLYFYKVLLNFYTENLYSCSGLLPLVWY